MKLVVAWITGLNICMSGTALLVVATGVNRGNQNLQIQTGLARIALRDHLDETLSLTAASRVRLQKGCAEKMDNGAVIIGSGEASHSRFIDGQPVNEASRFSYRASVNTKCDAYNLNCYAVNNMDMDGSRSIAPRL
jgi:hypothetical protein